MIKDLTEEDNGSYQCRAKNVIDTLDAVAELVVQGKRAIFSCRAAFRAILILILVPSPPPSHTHPTVPTQCRPDSQNDRTTRRRASARIWNSSARYTASRPRQSRGSRTARGSNSAITGSSSTGECPFTELCSCYCPGGPGGETDSHSS
jgi:hypothetical protein